MTDSADPQDEGAVAKKKSKLPLILGVVMALLGGGGGFMAVQMGLIGGSAHASDAEAEVAPISPLEPMAFLPLDPLVVTLAPGGRSTHLKFAAQLEVAPDHLAEVEQIKPRIIDLLNGYLRAVEVSDLEDPTALIRLRAQMLRRIQVVAGEGRVRDLLVMEFVLN